ncbi:MAG TPA: hypothetical protein VHG28_22360 [Longimicrobiaceae bacterium]|nr:hypothetical protein [Longimicrobiaceae bacterium]
MSRSRRRTPIGGISSADSEKQDKRQANRRIRRTVRQVLHQDPAGEMLPHEKELSNPWTMSKDGKRWFDPERYPREMRK